MRIPDFFIVGAPKCGTTAMQDYLSQHPEIFMPEVKPPLFLGKEFHFFGSDLKFIRPTLTKEKYLSYFQEAKNEKRVGEASTWYLYSKRAAYEIKEFNPSASIIIMLRNPVDMIYSVHSQALYNGDEDIDDFKTALDAEPDRKSGLRLPKRVVVPVERFFYREVGQYTEQVKRYSDVFGSGNVLVIIFDDFKANTAKIYKETLRFLGVNEDFQPVFEIINSNKRARTKFLASLLRNPPQIAQSLAKLVIPQQLRQGLFETLKRYNTIYEPRPPMNPELRKSLQSEFAGEIERLSELLGRDLAHWTK
ncbi:MAG TPA: sulfotransferase domain-containing protein [Thermodesulfobacteriota bacterium]|nr:sulfotransferase domain-containing protein [Thermodesulfobacteriota bacterium]